MTQAFNIASLVDDLEPVRPMSLRHAVVAPAMLLGVAMAVILSVKGMRPDLLAGSPHPMFLLRGGTLLLLGAVCGTTLLSMASPGVGRYGHGWKIAVAAALLFPITAMIVATTGEMPAMESGLQCLIYSVATGAATAMPMVYWLRRGAPVSLERAGWLTGLAAGDRKSVV